MIAGAGGTYAWSTVGPLQETMRVALALTDGQIALLQGPALYLPWVPGAILLGYLMDRFSRARLLVILAALEVIGTVLTALAPNFFILLGARALIGLAICGTAMDASALVAGFVAPGQRGRMLTIFGIAQIAGMSAAFALGGRLAAQFGTGPDGWRWAMLALTVPLAFVFVLTLWVREPPRTIAASREVSIRWAFTEVWRFRGVMLPLAVGPVVWGMGYTAATVWSAPLLGRNFNLAPDYIGALMGLALLASGMLGSVLGGVLADFCQRTGGPRRTVLLLVALALLQAPTGAFGTMPSVVLMVLLLFMLCTISVTKSVICTSLCTVVIPNELLGLCFGILNALGAIFISLSPVVVSQLSTAIEGPGGLGEALMLVCVATSLVGATTFALGRRFFAGA